MAIVSQLFIPFLFITWGCVKMTLLATKPPCGYASKSCLVLLSPVASCDTAKASLPPTTPTAGQGIPLLNHTPCYSAATAASHRSEPAKPRTPLHVGIHCRVFPGSVSSPS